MDEELLFSYGTLQEEVVQLETFHRKLKGTRDSLVGYKLTLVQVSDAAFAKAHGATQRNAQFTGDPSDVIDGVVLRVSKSELEQCDAYEPEDYKRAVVQLKSGTNAWLYVKQS